MSIFGWSYPPGCNSVPGDDEEACEICFQNVDDCVCRICPVCDTPGDASCYREEAIQIRPRRQPHHSRMMTGEQWRLRAQYEKDQQRYAEAEARIHAEQPTLEE